MIEAVKAIIFARHKDTKLVRAILVTLLPVAILWGSFAIAKALEVTDWYMFPYVITCLAAFIGACVLMLIGWCSWGDHN